LRRTACGKIQITLPRKPSPRLGRCEPSQKLKKESEYNESARRETCFGNPPEMVVGATEALSPKGSPSFGCTSQRPISSPTRIRSGGHGPARASIVLGNDGSGRGRRKPVFRAWHASSSMAGHSANTTPTQSLPFVSNALSTSYSGLIRAHLSQTVGYQLITATTPEGWVFVFATCWPLLRRNVGTPETLAAKVWPKAGAQETGW
jgi:hypothetical protein